MRKDLLLAISSLSKILICLNPLFSPPLGFEPKVEPKKIAFEVEP